MRLTGTILAAVLCLTAALGLFMQPQQMLAAEKAPVGKAAPAFTLPDVKTGGDVALADYKGKVVVLMFHSISCPFYALNQNAGYDRVFVKMVEAYKGKDVVFLGVNSNRNESTDAIKNYLEKNKINYTVVKDQGNVVADTYGAQVASHIMVIDAEGKLRYRGGVEKRPANPSECGNSQEQYLGPVIDALLGGSEPPVTETQATGCAIKRV